MKLLKLLVIATLIIFPFGEILRIDIRNDIVLKPLDFLVALTTGWWTILFIKNKNLRVESQSYNLIVKKIILAFVAIGFLSLLFNSTWLKTNELFVSLLYLVRWFAYALIFFIIIQFDEKFKEKIKLLLSTNGFLILLFGYLQYFFYNNLKSLYYLGWDEHMHRMFSVFFDPNYLGAFLSLYFLFIGGIIIKYKVLSIRYKLSLYIILILTLVAIFLTFSRSAILMLIVSSATFFFLINKKRLILILLGVLLLFIIIASPKFYDENMNLFRFNSGEARIANDLIAWEIIQDHPILGVGFNSYRYTKDLYGLRHSWTNTPSHADAGVDNSFLFVLATTGLIGGIIYLTMWIFILKHAFIVYKKNMLAIVLIASSIGLFVDSLFINSLFFAHIMLWLWFLIGLAWKRVS